MRKTFALMMVLAAALAMLAGGSVQADAGDEVFTFEGTASLPDFPCDGCSGTFEGSASSIHGGEIEGVLTATFDYSEPDDCLSGTAEGIGRVDRDGVPDITFDFSWDRVGLNAVIEGEVTAPASLEGLTFSAVAAFEPDGPGGCPPNDPSGADPITAAVAGAGAQTN